MTPEYTRTFTTPLGVMRVSAVPRGITAVSFVEREETATPGAPSFVRDCERQVREYLVGERSQFVSLPIVLHATDFQLDVWDAALAIPYGETRTYGQIARALRSEAVRAVGTALSRNALAIIIPCHRVIPRTGKGGSRARGTYGGYAGGAWRKEWLLAHERA